MIRFSLSWSVFMWHRKEYCGIFRNSPHVKPGRWGFYILGLEIGSRNPGNKFGTWLKKMGLWPW